MLLPALVLAGCASQEMEDGRVVPLRAVRVLPIESPFPVEPSGLCLRDGRLYSVSDDTDDTIFELVPEDEVARFVPALVFSPPGDGVGRLDLEGITTGPSGSFYLASEEHVRVLQVFPDGTSEWVTPSGLTEGKEAGLFRNPAGQVEGLTRLPGEAFLMAAEREPRGLLTYAEETGFVGQPMLRTRYAGELSLLRPPDFTGLDTQGGAVWVLHRNAALVGRLEAGPDGWRETAVAWSFKSVVDDPEYAYRDKRFGIAEGLAVDEGFFYVVLDNNGDRRSNDPSDRRPLLLILERPGGA